MNLKKGQVNIVIIALIVLIAAVAILIAWNLIIPLVKEKSQKANINQFSINLEITEVSVFETGASKIIVKRGPGGGQIDNLRFIFYDENGNSRIENKEGLSELESKNYDFSQSSEFGKIQKLSVAPVINGNLGLENKAETNNILKIPSGVINWWKNENGSLIKYYSDGSLSFDDQMAVSFWINGSGELDNSDYTIKIENDEVNFSCSGESFGSNQGFVEGWNHIVISIAPAFLLIYINNNLVYSGDVPAALSVINLDLTISGKFDNIMLFNKALSSPEIEGIYVYQKK
ncbi:MAG: hypothetical protein PHH54_03990 [Candidatus Nanoarchaeia archaeon]|nr:hypothetical protein [Candidatus Nanoarchaeia archaeon]MDD5741120.1 hypothetical protein [Candidatus Nanoarchaeia archaeon]